ncbi:MAG: DUF4091 domain-containing protein, partial [Bacteroidales bacterium]|nr:DUF4091 domain-containing protein [Bacteroidales bacterium]
MSVMILFNRLCVVLSLFICLACINQRPSITCPTYEEKDDPAAKIDDKWAITGRGLHVSFGSTDIRYARHQVPMESVVKEMSQTAWRGERISAQAVLWSVDPVRQVECVLSEFKTEHGDILPAESFQVRFVRYVLTDEFAGGCGYRKAADLDSSLVADVLDSLLCIDMPLHSVRPVWLTVDIPQDAKPGLYTGSIKFYSKRNPPQELKFTIDVLARVLPSSENWSFHLDLWQNPFAIARWHNVELWSEEHFTVMRPYLNMLANAGQKCVTASIINHPWNSQTYDPFLSMIKWIKKTDGRWEYDYSVFDKWVEFAFSCGIGKQINCYTMVPWSNSFQYFDEKKNETVELQANPGSSAYTSLWKPFLKDFTGHLHNRGWFGQTTIAMDERSEEDMKEVIRLVKSADAGFKLSLAANHWYPDIMDDIYDLCVASEFNFPLEMKNQRRAEGKITTYYTCCSENYPNTFTFSPPAESAWLAWYSAALDLDGYLRWAYNSWVENPLTDSRFRSWPAGDTYLV